MLERSGTRRTKSGVRTVGDVPATDNVKTAGAPQRPPGPPLGRHPRDLVVLCVATGLVALCWFFAWAVHTSPLEVATFEQVQEIPAASTELWRGFADGGSWIGIAVVTGVALYLRRIRLGLQIAAAGVLGWVVADAVGGLLGRRPMPVALLADAATLHLPGPGGFAFPAAHAATIAAMATVAAPYLRPHYRWIAWAVVVLVATADVYLGTQLPLGALAGVFLGWGIGAAFHLAFGAPGRRTSIPNIRWALERVGLQPVEIVTVRGHWLGPLEYSATTANGPTLRVEAVRRLHRRAGPWYRLRRLLASLEVEDEPALSSVHHETDHEALVTVLAQRAGVRSPSVLLTCETRHHAPLLVREQIDGRRLTDLPREEIDDRLLDAIWGQVATLAAARIAHHDLRARNILVDRSGDPWLINFTFARIGASAARTGQDIAEALVALTALVGVARTVDSACRVLDPGRLEPALVYLQPLALPRRIRKQMRQERYLLTDLRETLAERIDRPIPTFRSPVRPATVVSLVLLGGAVYTVLPQLSSMREVIASFLTADWMWLVVSTVTGFVAIVLSGVSIMGSSATALPFWKTTAVQVAAAFTGRTTPGGVGFFGVNIAFMERRGFRRASALGVTMLNMAATSVVGGLWCLVGLLAIGGRSLEGLGIPEGWPIAAAVGVLVVVVGLLATPLGRRRLVQPALPVVRELLGTLRKPVRALQLFGGVTGYLIISGLGLAAALAAFHAPVPVFGVIAVFMVGQTLGHIVPIPGGIGPTEALMIGGLTALGIVPTVAVAAVLAARLLTYWLPVLPGVAVFRYLQHHGIV